MGRSESRLKIAFTAQDAARMRDALALAGLGHRKTAPNPVVGAVIVKAGRIVGTGWHRRAGTAHAEVHAIAAARGRTRGATLYTTLEPCDHVGRTAKCTDAILHAGITRVVVATRDPSPRVNGAGIRRLRREGVRVDVGLLEAEARAQNSAYEFACTRGRPLVTLKVALTLDGKIATETGDSKWVTSEAARRRARALRAENDAVLVGVETILADDPRLTARFPGAREPLRVVLDSRLRTPPDAALFHDVRRASVLIATAENDTDTRAEIRARLESRGAEIVEAPADAHGIRIDALLAELQRRGVQSLLVEGGARVHGSFIRECVADRLVAFVAPKLLGDARAKSFFHRGRAASMADAIHVEATNFELVGGDIMLTGRFAFGGRRKKTRTSTKTTTSTRKRKR
ncbi:MAG: bifunctional diaminohydroxyphosphoribosylaminopyrimidine deaminase/5-amino-6-(5-phosphoribosylamino)uracil reductase RibD [Deltaproteobacteria bacterium]|nr:bifunctional diaminohydroxyphosphoribosylaminopyrimidine deaminase/5-amino-6-(5-phosphoribosylamino)uracil reductase RibD [Deltaproteobacteria bacterium]